MRAATFAWSLFLTIPAFCSDAQACSVLASYRVPTNLELVEQADAIVLARVADNGPSTFERLRRAGGRLARLVPFATLKGDYAGRHVDFPDASLELPSAGLRATPSDPRNLADPNPDVFSGSCSRYVFRKDMNRAGFVGGSNS